MARQQTLKPGDHLYLIDGSGYIFRAYHALPPLTRKSDGLPVGAVQGFCNMLWKLLKDTNAGQKPTHLAVIFDKSSKTFRNDIYPAIQGAAPRAAGRSPPAVRPDPPGDPRLQRRLRRAGQFRGRRSHRHLCAPGGGGRRHLPHRLLRQGPDAADPPRRDALRHDEGPRRGRGRRCWRNSA